MEDILVIYKVETKCTNEVYYKRYFMSEIESKGLSRLFDIESYNFISREMHITNDRYFKLKQPKNSEG